MAHPRQEIREAIAAALTDETAAEDRVYETRIVPWRRAKLPAISVYTLEESAEESGSAPPELKRTIQLAVECAVWQGENLDDAIDAICLEVEHAMRVDHTFAGKASESTLTATTIDIFEEGDKLIGVARLVYEVVYFSFAYDEDQDLDTFDTANVTYNTTTDEDDQATDLIEDINQE